MQFCIEDFERWKFDIALFEKRLINLESRIDNLLLIAQGSEGFHSFFVENFTDMSHVDLDNSDVFVDIASRQIYLPSESQVGNQEA